MPIPAICTFCKQDGLSDQGKYIPLRSHYEDGIIIAMDTTVKKDGTYCKSGLAYTVIGVIIKLSHASISAAEKLPFNQLQPHPILDGNVKFCKPKYHVIHATLAAGIVIVAFGVICTWIGTSVVSPIQEGEGFKIVAIRFLIGGIVSIILAFIAKYFMLIKYLLKQISFKGKSGGDKFYDWHKPQRRCVSLT